jgi:type II secretory pathway component PulF
MEALLAIRATADWWAVLVPLLFGAYFGYAWWQAQYADVSGGGLQWWSLGLARPIVRLRRSTQLAGFTHLLALLTEHLVPLPEALRLASQSTGGPRLKSSAQRLAEQMERGEHPREALPGVPPVLSWLLAHPPPAGELAPALRLLADGYSAEARRETDMLSWYGPVVLTSLVGGGTVAIYCLLVAGPWLSVLYAYIEQALS